MLKVLKQAFPDDAKDFATKIREMIPSYGTKLSQDPRKAAASLKSTAAVLNIK
jgi:malate dehydrogenase (quinone)